MKWTGTEFPKLLVSPLHTYTTHNTHTQTHTHNTHTHTHKHLMHHTLGAK